MFGVVRMSAAESSRVVTSHPGLFFCAHSTDIVKERRLHRKRAHFEARQRI